MPDLLFVSWEEFYELSFELAQKIKNSGKKFDIIVSISRGGHVISRILSDLLGLQIFNVSIQSYEAMEQKRLTMLQKLNVFLDEQNILLVDEIVDTGLSLERAVSYLQRIRAKHVTSVVLHVKPHAQVRPDVFVVETAKWVVYPYEIRETWESLNIIGRKTGFSEEEVMQALIKGGMKERYLEWVKQNEGIRTD